MTIRYKLNFGGKPLAQWAVENRLTKPSNRIVLVPREVLMSNSLKTYFRRAKVVSRTETDRGFDVELEAVLMPGMEAAPRVNSLGSVPDYSPI